MLRAATLLLAVLACSGCSLPRAALGGGGGIDGGGLDGGGLDVGEAIDAWSMPGSDTGADATADAPSTEDAWVPFEAGRCNHDGDCPADVVVTGACGYADACATSAPDATETTTHYRCVGHACTPTTTSAPLLCTRETDGSSCGGDPACGLCSATSCGGMGSRSCIGPMCLGGVCEDVMTTMPCTTPDDMCGGVPGWSPCYYSISRGRCVQTRTWGQCVLGTCTPGVGNTDVRDCSC